MTRRRRNLLALSGAILGFAASLAFWIQWSNWPDSRPMPRLEHPDAIVILGGGDGARVRQGAMLAGEYPDTPLIVTGDNGTIVQGLVAQGVPKPRIQHEQSATSTVENAKSTGPLLDKIGAKRVILVTNWFHAPRALSIFRKYQAGREFAVSFEPKPQPLSKWDIDCQRRERMAVIHNLLLHGVWSW